MSNFFKFLFLFLGIQSVLSQNSSVNAFSDVQRYPVFSNCDETSNASLEKCFNDQLQDWVYSNFKAPTGVSNEGSIKVLFEVTSEGQFMVLYIDSFSEELQKETQRVFKALPKIQPATYNGKPTYSKFTLTISLPLQTKEVIATNALAKAEILSGKQPKLTELDSIVYKKYRNPEYTSNLNVPFSHQLYAQFDAQMNQVGSNNHTASKPYTYTEVAKYYDMNAVNSSLQKKVSGWWGRKLWNENMVQIQGEDYWFTLNPVVDLQLGRASQSDNPNTFVNTRALNFRGGLGKQLNFTTTVFESQGRFAGYYNQFAESLKPSGGNPAIIPGIGIAKRFKEDAYDFPLAEANITFTPNKFIDLQLGYGRNFIGDGYRSLLESDGASPYPFFKINTNFWKIKYTNTYMWLKDVRPEVTVDRTYATKFMANHYLSWNVSNRLNLGFFESVVWTKDNNRGFDMSFVNPIIFYRAVEFSSSSRSGNALLGLTFKYKWNPSINMYGQFLLDEFSLGDIKERDKSWKNKFGYQLGAKYYNAFKVKNLLLQVEYNHVRPYVYSHSNPITNYAHNNQSLGHQWGGNFSEFIALARYNKGRLFADAKFTFGTRGLDFDTKEDSFNYGGNIYKDYDEKRPFDNGVKVGQGNKTKVFIADIQGGYLVNPTTNLKVFASYIYRNFDPTQNTLSTFTQSTNWLTFGVRTDIFNFYFDY